MKTSIELIAEERQRQITEEQHSLENDQNFRIGELALAGASYAIPFNNRLYKIDGTPNIWPFDPKDWKPVLRDRIRELVKAGALIAAEIDRLQQMQLEAQK